MTEAANVAKNTLAQRQALEKKDSSEEVKFVASRPFSRAGIKDETSSVHSFSSQIALDHSMGKEGEEKSDTTVESKQQEARIPTNGNKEENFGNLSEQDNKQSRIPDRPSEKSQTVVVPSVIRVSPPVNSGADKTVSSAGSKSPTVVRPRASKTPPQGTQNGKLRPNKEPARTPENGARNEKTLMDERGDKGGKQLTRKKEVVKRRDEAQVTFPRRSNKPNRTTAGMPPHDGQAPTQHVQYSNAAGGGGARHGTRQDPHGYRQQHGRGQHSTSITSSTGGTPTLAARRAPHHPRGLSTGSDMENEPSPSIPSVTPMFQRLVTDEVQELKTYTRIIEEQNRRVTELERRTTDLEKRLAKANRDKADLERTLEFRETEWRNKFDRLESDRDHQKELVEQEKRMNSKLNYQVVQMEQEIHKFLTRKYPPQRDNAITNSMRNVRMVQSDRTSPSLGSGPKKQSPSSPGLNDRQKQFKSPREILENDGRVEVVRKRNISSSLLDFFGMA